MHEKLRAIIESSYYGAFYSRKATALEKIEIFLIFPATRWPIYLSLSLKCEADVTRNNVILNF